MEVRKYEYGIQLSMNMNELLNTEVEVIMNMEASRVYTGPRFMLLLSNYVLHSNVNYIYLVSCLVEINLYCIK